ncbi:MAG: response regulator transcription factor [Thermomicrobiales bacterium]|nr:response regulator transcription factor [Thermomicrobiales bacterium]
MRERQAIHRPHVLIVSDDPGLVGFLGEGLIYAGFWTSVIASAFQALEVFRLRSFDLILLDAALGGMGAPELLRRLRGQSDRATRTPRTDIPLFLIAGSPREAADIASEADGADGVLAAPLELEDLAPQLLATVQAWRARHPDRLWADAAALAGVEPTSGKPT